MTEYELDIISRKNLAGQARHRKRGSKSKKCTLPSDRLTNKQWKERCGIVVVYSPNKPMVWSDFKQLCKASQEEYLKGLQEKYGATAKDMAAMFGLNPVSVRRFVEDHGLDVVFARGAKRKTPEQIQSWNIFLGIEQQPESAPAQINDYEPFEVSNSVDEQIQADCSEASSYMEMEQSCQDVVVSQFSISFTGKLDIDMIANSLRQILGNNAVGKIQIGYEFA